MSTPSPASAVSSRLHDWLVLTKLRISAVSTLTAATGYLAEAQELRPGLVSTAVGTLALALSASALNEVQERDIDARMQRTRTRPLPGGRVSTRAAVSGAVLLVSLGSAVLYLGHGPSAALLGLLALFWYNAVYTPLKRVSAFAVFPGALIGALPPAIGWVAAGGSVMDPALTALSFVFFVWQVPHFWLLALRHQEDYERGGLPTLSKYFSATQIQRLVFTWTGAAVVSCALLGVFQAVRHDLTLLAIGLAGAGLLARFRFMLEPEAAPTRLRRAFMDINRFAVVIMAAVVLDALVT
ncbi:MAG: protoheme IX farnesyltransferase [Polyangiaceae bacterium]|nr:protoheme IX farnesyltransferase [Polyangiaceae bacterium]